MPVEFVRQDVCENGKCASTRLTLDYDGSGRRISKTRMMKTAADGDWYVDNVTHYTGIGTEVRELIRRSASPKTTVVVNLPQGLGRYMPEDAVDGLNGVSGSQLAGYRPPAKFEWYLKNHLGSTMLVYGTQPYNDKYSSYAGGVKAAYDYRATVVAMRTKQQVAKCCPPFGEQVDLTEPTDKVTENFTGKEKDDETELNYFGARYLDPMLGLWISVDPARQFSSPYLYAGNGMNPVNGVDGDGNVLMMQKGVSNEFRQGVADAIAYLNARGAAGEIASLHSKGTVVTLAPATGDDTGPRFDANTNTLYWNPKVGAVDVRGNMVSPALLLVHEAAHANNWIDNPEDYINKSLDQSPEATCDALGNVLFGDAEEKRVIQGPEWDAADKLNEPRRASHAGDEISWE